MFLSHCDLLIRRLKKEGLSLRETAIVAKKAPPYTIMFLGDSEEKVLNDYDTRLNV